MKGPKTTLMNWLLGLRFPVLLVVTTVLLVVNLLIPDALPFVDEILLGLITVVLSRLKRGRKGEGNTTPPS
jgi:hypothetical protein